MDGQSIEFAGGADASAQPDPRNGALRTPEELAAARSEGGWSVGRIASRLRTSENNIAALEAGDWDALPHRAFARAAVRSIAGLLGRDATPLICSIGGFGEPAPLRSGIKPVPAVPVASASMIGGPRSNSRGGSRRRFAVPAAIAAGLLAVFMLVSVPGTGPGGATDSRIVQVAVPGGAQSSGIRQPVKIGHADTNIRPAIRDITGLGQGAAAGVAAVLPAVSSGSTATAVATDHASARRVGAIQPQDESATQFPVKLPATESVELVFSKATWVDIRHKDGEKLLFGTQKARKSVVLNGVPPMQVVIGNPDGVKMRFRGEPVDIQASSRKGVSRFVLN